MTISDQLPLSEATYLILTSLASRPRHGYGIMKDVEGMSQGRVRLSTGTLYGALRRLLQDGWIARLSAEQSNLESDGRNQKYYRLTSEGEKLLRAEVDRLSQLLVLAQPRPLRGGA
jgi:DNA-binding PadR family transcriptional regulator